MDNRLFAPSFLFLFLFHLAAGQSFIGVNYGQVADNLPPPDATASLLRSTTIEKVRLYGADPAMIRALAGTGIGIMIGVSNGDIPEMASDPAFAQNWVASNVLPFYPASKIAAINVGNEVLYSGDRSLMSQLLPAMQNLENALGSASLGGKIKVSTVHGMSLLISSAPPSAGRFDPGVADLLKGLLSFNNATGSQFLINPYPFFAYQSDPRPETLSFCLFQPNSGRIDSGTNIKYTNMFDAQLDAVRSALNAAGFKDVEIGVAETGWPYRGDSTEVGPGLENAKAYVGNLVSHLRSLAGTPLMPGKSVDTYVFALYNEDLKPGPTSERSFGLFNLDSTMTFDAGLSKSTVPGQCDFVEMEWDCESLAMSSSKQECVNSAEPLVGLKLGKRTYFQNSNVHSSSSNGPASPAPIPKRGKPSSKGSEISRCQVDGCNLDLSSAKKYHQKHRVCDSHSKCPNVIVGGVERRFCQQCSRFHGLSEFDEKKRSCRRRLSDHNARRRNPRRQSIHFNSSFYEFADDRKQMSFVLNKGQLVPSRIAENSSWDSETSKFTNREELTSNPGKTSTIMRQSSGFPLPNAASNAWDWPLAYDGTTAEAFNQGAKGSMFPSNVGTIPEFCALSLLSSPSPGSFEPKFISSGGNNVHENQSSIPELMLHEVPQIMPLASTEYWQWQSSADFHGHSLVPNTNGDLFPEIQLFKAPCDTDFYFTAFK